LIVPSSVFACFCSTILLPAAGQYQKRTASQGLPASRMLQIDYTYTAPSCFWSRGRYGSRLPDTVHTFVAFALRPTCKYYNLFDCGVLQSTDTALIRHITRGNEWPHCNSLRYPTLVR